MKTPKPPKAPDPRLVTAAQTEAEQKAAAYNNAITHGSSTTPFGQQTYTGRVDPTTGATVYDENVTLAPAEQQQLDLQRQQNLILGGAGNKLAANVAGAYDKPVDTSGLPGQEFGKDIPQLYGADDLLGARQQVQDALYKRATGYLDPQFQQGEESLRTRLANQGFSDPRNAAVQSELDAFGRERTGAYDTARTSAILGGSGEMEALSNIARGNRASALDQQGFGNQARAQALEQILALRNQPLNELNALRSATPINAPNFSEAGEATTNAVDPGANIWNAYNSQLQAWNASQQGKNALLQGLMGLGGTLGGAAIGKMG